RIVAIRNDKTETQIKPIARFRIRSAVYFFSQSGRSPLQALRALNGTFVETFRASTCLSWRYSAADAWVDNCLETRCLLLVCGSSSGLLSRLWTYSRYPEPVNSNRQAIFSIYGFIGTSRYPSTGNVNRLNALSYSGSPATSITGRTSTVPMRAPGIRPAI